MAVQGTVTASERTGAEHCAFETAGTLDWPTTAMEGDNFSY